jgi:hypothetical protein
MVCAGTYVHLCKVNNKFFVQGKQVNCWPPPEADGRPPGTEILHQLWDEKFIPSIQKVSEFITKFKSV